MVMVYRLSGLEAEEAGARPCFVTKQFLLRSKVKADWDENWDLPPSRLDEQGRYFPQNDPFAPAWSRLG